MISALSLCFLFAAVSSQRLRLGYMELLKEIYIHVGLGDRFSKKFLLLDLQSPISFLRSEYYIHEEHAVELEDGIYYRFLNATNIPYTKAYINFVFRDSNTIITNFTYYFFKTHLSQFDSATLSLNVESPYHSIVHLAHSQKKISELKFGFHNKRGNEGHFFIGSIPKEILETFPFRKKCFAGQNWGCQVSKVFFGNKTYANDHEVLFQTAFKNILVPEDFHQLVLQNFLNKYLSENICNITMGVYLCDCTISKEFPGASFVIDRFVFPLSNGFFNSFKERDKCEFIFAQNKEAPQQWVIGYDFLNQYTTQYDFEERSVTFFSKEKFRKDNNFYIKTLLLLLIFIIGLFTIFLAIIKKIY